jgi:hypothetical protein
MQHLRIAVLCVLGVTLTACGTGSSSSPNTIDGNWTATLSNPDGSPAFGFTTSLNQRSGAAVTVTNLSFTTSTPCFLSGGTETGAFVLSGTFDGSVNGAFQMTVQSGTPSGNTLTLQGTAKNNAVAGAWSLSGVTSGCTGSGTFLMTRM